MGFLFDSLVHLLASEPEAKERALARMLGRVLAVEPAMLGGEGGFRIWHYPKAIPRPFAASFWLGEGCTRLALSLADAKGPDHPARPLLQATRAAPRGDLVALPEGCLGRSSHRHAIVVGCEGFLLDYRDYERIAGTPIDLVVPVTTREATWIQTHGAAAFAELMREQEVGAALDRVPGTTELPV